MSTEIKGLDVALAKLSKFKGRIEQIAKSELFKEGEGVMAMSKEAFVPVDQGPLRASGQVDPPVVSGNSVTVTLGYGNSAVDYATIVHEDLNAFHPGGGQAKYLEEPLKMAIPGVKSRMGSAMVREARRLKK